MLQQSTNQPDILEVISDLSNDEVFTPPKVANAVLDLLPGDVWSNPDLRWLDPGTKTGVFIREVTRRLLQGLSTAIPVEEERLRHILTSQVFEMSHNRILHEITLEAVSGGVPERKAWIKDSGHFKVGNLAKMTAQERKKMVDAMRAEGH